MIDRRPDIDTAKGIGMVLVIMGHATPPSLLQEWIYGAHMPLFFVLSGMLWSGHVRPQRSAQALLVPFFVASLLSWAFWMAKEHVHPAGGVPWWGPLLATVYGGNIQGYLVHNTPLWFLPAMFAMLATLWCLQKAAGTATSLVCLGGAGLAVTLAAPWLPELDALPWSWGQGLVGGLFFALGYAVRLQTLPRGKPGVVVWMTGAATYLVLAHLNGRVDLFSMTFGNPVIYVTCGLLGALLVYTASGWPPLQLGALQRVGRHSLIVLAVHLPVLWIARALLPRLHTPAVWYTLSLFTLGMVLLLLTLQERRTTRSRAGVQ